jgi:arylsulfatase A-like enzyme
MDWLSDNKLKSNTLVILTSDNGGLDKSGENEHRASGTLHSYKGTDWEGGHRVPFFVRWPDVAPPGVTCDQPMVLTDLFATFAELTGRSMYEDSTKQGMDSTSIYQHLVNTEVACGLNGNRAP